ncbi:DUF1338 domain-containing protein [Aliterella atlantica]|uniref:2-oxoadipate dioxygenase/decarboxylase n=1 Tax=Aliterella atlantica CENA595 TaxID=1618023 RepID=A0A0D8ZM34_9CYAN|nr:DUF1338 domain-containing protein [Aliterella atlantica]KJH69888.1 hypothetical protein UH38_21370 [Aliterella atlantica CENA595]
MNSQFTRQLWDRLWQNYIARVTYAQTYQQMILNAGGTIANDHIAFRSLRLSIDGKNLGINYLGAIAEALGYEVAGEYTFPETKLYARHYQHSDDLPKLFISELIVEELPDAIASLIYNTVSSASILERSQIDKLIAASDIETIAQIYTRPWLPPKLSIVEKVNAATQYGAWVLLHGYAVNHFTGYINSQNTPQYPDIENTASALSKLGVPMKAEIEGSKSSGLRQTATFAINEMVSVVEDSSNQVIQIPWTYAYYELAERSIVELEPGKKMLFNGFKGNNAQNLFEMTRKS